MISAAEYRAELAMDLPWPSRDLHPNARVHWARRAKAAKAARRDAAWAAKAAGFDRMEADTLSVTVTFSPPNNRAHDVDGLLSNVKSYLDGIADVIAVDDRNWSIVPVKVEARPLGNVRIEIGVVR